MQLVLNRRPATAGALALALAVAAGPAVLTARADTMLFQPPVHYAAGTEGAGHSHQAIKSADLDADGDADLAVVDSGGGAVRILFNQGAGTFGGGAAYPTGPGPSSVAVADLDADGDPDLAVTNEGVFPGILFFGNPLNRLGPGADTVVVLFNHGDGTFARGPAYATGPGPVDVVAADFNGDGRPDLATAAAVPFGNIVVLLNQGGGQFVRSSSSSVGTGVLSMVTADVDGDASPDLLVGDVFTGRVIVLLSNGDGTFSTGATVATYTGLEAIAAGDANGDGAVDIVIPNLIRNSVSVFLGRGDGSFGSSIDSPVNPEPLTTVPPTINVAAEVHDLDDDGANDLVVSGGADQRLYVMLGDATGRFATTEWHPVGTPRTIISDDFDLDGQPDLAVTELRGGIAVLLHS
ncbi:MAG: FG-GAP repeat domain-containing protein [Acidimicrobiales bacterium]